MSSVGVRPPAPRRPAEWDHLELAVRRLLDDYDRWRSRAQRAEERVRELEATLRDVSDGTLDPVALAERIDALEAENRALRTRLDQARDNIHRILARLQFLEEAQ